MQQWVGLSMPHLPCDSTSAGRVALGTNKSIAGGQGNIPYNHKFWFCIDVTAAEQGSGHEWRAPAIQQRQHGDYFSLPGQVTCLL